MDMTKLIKTVSVLIVIAVALYIIGFITCYEKKKFEFNLNGESGKIYWIRDFRHWVPADLEKAIDFIYSPAMRCGLQAGKVK
jgi:hypothetical protein